jgi:site-specific DNA-methyltransferase (adenine-specific)
MIPERFAIGMIDRGWILRNVIIWHKPNCMPASVTDRFTVDFEPVYFFTKKEHYYFEQQIEPYDAPLNRWGGASLKSDTTKTAQYKETMKIGNSSSFRVGRPIRPNPEGKNKRTVWHIPTKTFSGAHFAVFPEKLIEPMVKAGCPPGGIVLDPFMGSGTTCIVAKRLGRAYCGIDLKLEYVEMAKARIESIPERLDSYESEMSGLRKQNGAGG